MTGTNGTGGMYRPEEFRSNLEVSGTVARLGMWGHNVVGY